MNGIQTEDHTFYGKVDELGIKPYFMRPTFYPQNQKYVGAQGENYALEANTMIYNGPFVMERLEA